jgi:hypothetical protein
MGLVRMIQFSFCALMLCAMSGPRCSADDWNKETMVTISHSLEIPRQVLSPGTSIFKIQGDTTYRQLVQVWIGDKHRLLATVDTIPVTRDEVTSDTVFLSYECPGDSPPALRAWFYPGKRTGFEFVYPRSEFRTSPSQWLLIADRLVSGTRAMRAHGVHAGSLIASIPPLRTPASSSYPFSQ